MTTTLHSATDSVLYRLGDQDQDIWSRDEIGLYLRDGYDLYTRRTQCLFDRWVIENLPPVGNWQTDFEKYLIQQRTGWGYTDEPLHYTNSEQNLGTGGEVGRTYRGPAGLTSPSDRAYVSSLDDSVPTAVPGGMLPDSTVEVLRVTYDQLEMDGMTSQQMRMLDPLYETRGAGDPRFFLLDKDGINYMRLVPPATGEAVYDTVNGKWGVLTQRYESGDEGGNWTALILATASGDTLTANPSYAGTWNQRGMSRQWLSGDGAFSFVIDTGNNSSNAIDIELLDANQVWDDPNPAYDPAIYKMNFNDGTVNIQKGVSFPYTGTYTTTDTFTISRSGTTLTFAKNGTTILTGTTTSVGLLVLHASITYVDMSTEPTVSDLSVTGDVWDLYDTVVTTEASGYNTSGWGKLVHRTELFPAFGPWGSPTRIHPTAANIEVDITRLGRDLETYPMEIPLAFQKYVIYWAMSQALGREGPGQDLALAQHYAERFEMGVSRMFKKLNQFVPETVGRFRPPNAASQFGIGDPQLPTNYPRAF